MTESATDRLKRLRMRSWRRGMKEMDLILGGYADARLADMGAKALDSYESLLDENDQDLYKWVSGAAPGPAIHADLIEDIASFHGISRGSFTN